MDEQFSIQMVDERVELMKDIQKSFDYENEIKIKENQRDIENNENLKKIKEFNESISKSSETLVKINTGLLESNKRMEDKIDSLADILTLFSETFEDKTQLDEKQLEEQKLLLLELIDIMKKKDTNKLKKFFGSTATEIGLALVIKFIEMHLYIK